MTTVTVSPKYQVVIPKDVREAMGIKPGTKVAIFVYNNRIEFIPVKGIMEMRGFLKGMDTDFERFEDRE